MTFSSTSARFSDVVNALIGVINNIMPVLAGIAVLLFFWSCVRYIYKAGDSKKLGSTRKAIFWELIGIFVIFSLWGIMAFIQAAYTGDYNYGNVLPPVNGLN